MKSIKNITTILLISVVCWFALDFTLTSFNLGPWRLTHFNTGKSHEIYHHDLKANLNNKAVWGNVFYQICTNEYGFKISCNDAGKPATKNYDIAFIGDSFTEAVGMPYEDSFVGMYANANPQQSVVNLGVTSYAPSIYFKKIEYYLNQGFTFKHVIVGIDIGDIQDEAKLYDLSADESKVIDKLPTQIANENNPQKNINSQASSVQKEIQKAREEEQFFTQKFFEYTWYLNLIVHKLLQPEMGLKKFNIFPHRAGWTHMENPKDYGEIGVEGGKAQAISAMTKLKTLLDKHNIKMSVLVYPWPAQLMHAKRNHEGVTLWENFCKKSACYKFINANNIFYDKLEATSISAVINENFIRGDFHFNKTGNALVFEEIQKTLSEDLQK